MKGEKIIMRQEKEKVIMFGASGGGMAAISYLKKDYEVVGFSDNDVSKHGIEYEGYYVYPPTEIKKLKVDKVIITSCYYHEIGKQLTQLGLDNVYIFIEMRRNAWYTLERFDNQKSYAMSRYLVEAGKARLKKKVLVCAYCFPPIGGEAVQRPMKMVKYLRSCGYEPIVVAAEPGMIPMPTMGEIKIDESLLEELPNDIKILRFPSDTFTFFGVNEDKLKRFSDMYRVLDMDAEWFDKYAALLKNPEKKDVVGAQLLLPDIALNWVDNVLSAIENKIDMDTVDLVFTTQAPWSSAFLGCIIKQKYHIPWVLDYRDPWTLNRPLWQNRHYDSELIYKLENKMEISLAKRADHISVVVDYMRDEICAMCRVPSSRITVIENGYDEEDFIDLSCGTNSKFTICYNGTLYINDERFQQDSDCAIVLRAFNQLIESNKVEKNDVQLIMNGDISEELELELEHADVHGILTCNGYLEHKESLKIANSSSMLIAFGADKGLPKVGWGGKMCEYLRLNKPIILFEQHGGCYDEVAELFQCGKVFEYSEENQVADYIFENYQKWKQGISLERNNLDDIRKFSREALTEKLAGIFDTLLEG